MRHSVSNVTGIQKNSTSSSNSKLSKKSLTVRVERESVDRVATNVEQNRASTSRTPAEVSIVDRLASWEKKNDKQRNDADNVRGMYWLAADYLCLYNIIIIFRC